MQTRYTWMYAYLQVTDEKKKFNQGERKERKLETKYHRSQKLYVYLQRLLHLYKLCIYSQN